MYKNRPSSEGRFFSLSDFMENKHLFLENSFYHFNALINYLFFKVFSYLVDDTSTNTSANTSNPCSHDFRLFFPFSVFFFCLGFT